MRGEDPGPTMKNGSLTFDFHGIHFWATHTGAELDLLIFKNGIRRYSLDEKITVAPLSELASGTPESVLPRAPQRGRGSSGAEQGGGEQ